MTEISNPQFPTLVGRYPPKPSGAQAPGGDGAGDTASLTEVAQGFEAVFLRHLLAAAAASDFGGEDLFGSSGQDSFREMRDAQFAEIASKTGTIGFATQIEAQMARHLPSSHSEAEG